MSQTVLVCGHVTLDRYGEALLPGGSAWYASHAHRGLGARCRIATAAGPDLPPDALAGLDAEVAPAAETTRFVNAYAPDGRRTQRLEAVAPPLDPGRLPAAWRETDLLHLAPVIGEVDLMAFRAAVRARVVGLGVQGWVRARAPDGAVVQPPWRFDPADLAGVDAVCLGEDDLRGQGDLLDRLVAAVPIVAFTHGERGCELVVRGRTTWIGVHPAREVDPTGAGDVFAAGFLLGLARGADPVEAARLGSAAASVVVEGRAGDALPRVAEAMERALCVPIAFPP
jgi:1D-myo-inositol 3-kinase